MKYSSISFSITQIFAKLLLEEMIHKFEEDRDIMRSEAKENIAKLQEENCMTYNRKRKSETQYRIDELATITRTHFGVGLKPKAKLHGS